MSNRHLKGTDPDTIGTEDLELARCHDGTSSCLSCYVWAYKILSPFSPRREHNPPLVRTNNVGAVPHHQHCSIRFKSHVTRNRVSKRGLRKKEVSNKRWQHRKNYASG